MITLLHIHGIMASDLFLLLAIKSSKMFLYGLKVLKSINYKIFLIARKFLKERKNVRCLSIHGSRIF